MKFPQWILLLLCSIAACYNTALAQTTEFKIATVAPDGTNWMLQMRAGAEEITERTTGRVKLKFYPGGVMGSDAAVARKIRIGQLHGGAVTSSAFANIYPDIQLYTLPMQFRSHAEVQFVRQHLDNIIKQGMAENGLICLGFSNGGFAYLYTQQPVANLADLRKQKLWIPEGDAISEVVFKNANIAPIPLGIPDVYTSLQTGLINSVIATPSSLIALQWHNNMQYMTDVPLVLIMGMLIVDKRQFDRLSPADQEIMREVIGAKFAQLDEINLQDNQDARQVLQQRGMQFIKPTAAEQLEWQTLSDNSLPDLLTKGAYTSAGFAKLQELLQQYRAQQ